MMEKHPVIYYLKEQRTRFRELLELTCKKLKNFSYYDINSNFVTYGSEFNTIRYPDFTEFPYKQLTLIHNLIPSMQTKVTKTLTNRSFQNTKRSLKYLMC